MTIRPSRMLTLFLRLAASLLVASSVASTGATGLQLAAEWTAADYPPGRPRVPIGYDPSPSHPKLSVRWPRIDGPGFSVTVTNRGNATIERLQFTAIVESLGWKQPVRILPSETWTLPLRPGATMQLHAEWLTASDLDRLAAEAPRPIQIYLTPSHVRYADGTEWRLALNRSAHTHLGALASD